MMLVLDWLVVAEKFQRKGLGKFLMQVLELTARHAEMKGVWATVPSSPSMAPSFFEKLKVSVDPTIDNTICVMPCLHSLKLTRHLQHV